MQTSSPTLSSLRVQPSQSLSPEIGDKGDSQAGLCDSPTKANAMREHSTALAVSYPFLLLFVSHAIAMKTLHNVISLFFLISYDVLLWCRTWEMSLYINSIQFMGLYWHGKRVNIAKASIYLSLSPFFCGITRDRFFEKIKYDF